MKFILTLLSVLLFVSFAYGSADMASLRSVANAKRAPAQDPCSSNPCGGGETCCIATGNQAGCCPFGGACCCQDEAHCCEAPLKCLCTGCPGSSCVCTGCSASSGSCKPSLSF